MGIIYKKGYGNANVTRANAFDTSSIDLSEFIGQFYSDELSTAYHFKVMGDKLIAQHSRLSDIELNPIKKDLFSGNTWFFSQVEFIRDSKKYIIGCYISSGRVRNLRFQKMD